jgi:hypothetical protein
MSPYNKESLISKFSPVDFPSNLLSVEFSPVAEMIFSQSTDYSSTNQRTFDLSKCFVIEEVPNNNAHNIQKVNSPPQQRNHRISPQQKSSSWRKNSDGDKKGEAYKETHEVDIKINANSNESFSRKNSEETNEAGVICQETNFQIPNDVVNKLSQILQIVKISKNKNKKVNIKNIIAINQKLKLENDYPLWYMNCKKGLGSSTDILLGPFSSNQIVELYEKDSLNDLSELRLYLDFDYSESNPDSNFQDVASFNGKNFKLKDMAKVFGFQEAPKKESTKKRKFSSNYEEMYFNDSLYNMVLTTHTTPTNKKTACAHPNQNNGNSSGKRKIQFNDVNILEESVYKKNHKKSHNCK